MHTLELSLLLKLRRFQRFRPVSLVCGQLYKRYEQATAPVCARVHGREVELNPGNNYPFLVQDCLTFNHPLVELAHQVFLAKREAVTLVDVGAATGDTVLLLTERCGGQVKEFVCIEGDGEFCELLRRNMRQFSNVTIVHTLLARRAQDVPGLVKHHRGTAACIGSAVAKAVPLDAIPELAGRRVDVLKIDVDGFDGEVLAGASNLLKQAKPAVIFEWHPRLIVATGNDPLSAFHSLAGAGYDRFVWFDNTGEFSHFSAAPSDGVLRTTADYLLKVNGRRDAHFDVVALPPGSPVDEVALAAMDYAGTFEKVA